MRFFDIIDPVGDLEKAQAVQYGTLLILEVEGSKRRRQTAASSTGTKSEDTVLTLTVSVFFESPE